ncbi:MAG: hypothetical protein B7733_26455 [Myxococcales bacterium FL481]|nr:MAG: hypothetical protein B7733_26455 [Myxococcales bacterium FL481]
METLVRGAPQEEAPTTVRAADARDVEQELARHRSCYDSLVGPIDDSFARYVDLAGVADRPRSGRRLVVYGVTKGAFRVCEGAAAEIRSTAVAVAGLETRLEGFVARSEGYASVAQRLADELHGPTATRDTVAAIHADLLKAHAQWKEYAESYRGAIEHEQRRNDEPYLELLEREGKPLELHARAAIVGARRYVHCLTRSPGGDCSDAGHEFVARADAFLAYRDVHVEASRHVFWLRTFATDLVELRQIVTRGGTRRPPAPQAVLAAYQVLSRDAATLDFDFAPTALANQ